MFDQVTKNKYGFYSLKDTPTFEELKEYYASKYYQDSTVGYKKVYSDNELQYIHNKIAQKYLALSNILDVKTNEKLSLLDIGCGEGWALKYFKENSWHVKGLDYSEHGCRIHNPDRLEDLIVGPIDDNVRGLIEKNQKFNVIWLDNVLEHVIEPLSLLQDCRGLIKDCGVLVIEVPNDFSAVQQYLLANGNISKAFWVLRPDHISYFNREGLINICKEAGWVSRYVMGDFPIDFNLFNTNTNYTEDKSVGKLCHQARIAIENLMHGISPEGTNELYRAMSELGLGRQIIGFFSREKD